MACHEQVLADFGPCDILLNGAGGNHPSATTDKEYYEPGSGCGTYYGINVRF